MYIRSSTPSQLYKESRRYFGSDLVLPKIQSHLYHSNILWHYCGILHLGLVSYILGFNTPITMPLYTLDLIFFDLVQCVKKMRLIISKNRKR